MGSRLFFRISAIFLVMLLVFLFVTLIDVYVQPRSFRQDAYGGTVDSPEPEAAVAQVFGVIAAEGNVGQTVCGYLENIHILYETSPTLSALEANRAQYGLVVVCQDIFGSASEVDSLRRWLDGGTNVLLCALPRTENLEKNGLAALLGIRQVRAKEQYTGLRFVQGFMLGDMAEYLEYRYEATRVSLAGGAKVYGYAYSTQDKREGAQNEKQPPLVWRYQDGGGGVYVVNAPLMTNPAAAGVLCALMAAQQEAFLYPIWNGVLFCVQGMPFGGGHNAEELQQLYFRDSTALQRDVLLPSIEGLCRKYDVKPTFVSALPPGMRGLGEADQNMFVSSVSRLGGEVLEPGTSPFLGEEATRYPWLFAPTEAGSEPSGLTDVYLDDADLLAYRAMITAYGAIVQTLDMQSVLYPEGDDWNWTELALTLESDLALLRGSHPALDSVSASELAYRMRLCEESRPRIAYTSTSINVQTEAVGAFFLLRTDKEIAGADGCTWEELEKGAYIVTANARQFSVYLNPSALAQY